MPVERQRIISNILIKELQLLKMNCGNQINNSTRNYYKRSMCYCNDCRNHEIEQHMKDFDIIDERKIYCKICNVNIDKLIILEHINLLSHNKPKYVYLFD